LSGAWEGIWSDGSKSVLLVRRIDAGTADILLAQNRYGDDARLPWHLWARAKVAVESAVTLEWKGEWTSYSFTLSPDGGTLIGVCRKPDSPGQDKALRISMTRRPVERVAAARIVPPFVCGETGKELHRIEAEQDPKARTALADTLVERWKKSGTPLVERGSRDGISCCTFIYSGRAREVALAGVMNGFSPEKDFLSRVAGTDLFFVSQEYPSDARLEYMLAVDGRMILDPLNPRTMAYGRGVNSEAAMPAYRTPPEIEPDPKSVKGATEEFLVESKQPGLGRKVTVYLPTGYADGTERYPVLYLNDAFGALKFGRIVTILDNLIARKTVPPLIVVLVPSVKDRIAEYSMNPAFEAFFVGDLVTAVDKRYRTRPSPEYRGIGGISAGATAALSLAIRRPDLFGKCIAQSTATKLVPLIQLARTGPARPLSVYFDVGSFESDFNGRDLVDSTRRLRDALRAHGCTVRYREVNEGHGWANWRARTRDALTFLFGAGLEGAVNR
jgi:enterochelin esterase family protein